MTWRQAQRRPVDYTTHRRWKTCTLLWMIKGYHERVATKWNFRKYITSDHKRNWVNQKFVSVELNSDGEKCYFDAESYVRGLLLRTVTAKWPQDDPTEGEYSTRIRRDRANKQKSCVHKIGCYNGDHLQLEQMKIMPNCKIFFQKFPVFLRIF